MTDKTSVISKLARAIYLLQINENQQGKQLLNSALSSAARLGITDLYEVSREDLAFLLSRAIKYGIEPEYSKRLADYNFLSIEIGHETGAPDWPVRIEIFNRLYIEKDGLQTNFTGHVNRSHFRLLVSLITNGDGKLPIEQLKENLWPGRIKKKKDHRFYVAVTQLRKIIGVDSLLFRGDHILLNRRRCWVDYLSFKTMVNDLKQQSGIAGIDIYELVHDIYNVITKYKNNFLVGLEDFYWRKNMASASKEIIIQSVIGLGSILEKNVETDTALSLYRAALDIDDLNEELYAKSMRCLGLMGHLTEAREIYQKYKDAVTSTGKTLPSEKLLVLHRQLVAQGQVVMGNA